jgi:hypothetical protein
MVTAASIHIPVDLQLLSRWFLAQFISLALKMEAIFSSETSVAAARHLLLCWFLAQFIYLTLKMEAICSSETSIDSPFHLLSRWFLAQLFL